MFLAPNSFPDLPNPTMMFAASEEEGAPGISRTILGLRTPSIFSIQIGGWWVHYHAAGPRTKRSHSVWPSYAWNILVFHGALLLCSTVPHHSSPSLLEALWDLQHNRKNHHWWVLTTQNQFLSDIRTDIGCGVLCSPLPTAFTVRVVGGKPGHTSVLSDFA